MGNFFPFLSVTFQGLFFPCRHCNQLRKASKQGNKMKNEASALAGYWAM